MKNCDSSNLWGRFYFYFVKLSSQFATPSLSLSLFPQLRSHMIFVCDNLQQYFMADVLESACARLSAALDASENFEQLRHAHDVFVNAVVAQIFLDNKAVRNTGQKTG